MFNPFKEIEEDYKLYYSDLKHFLLKFTTDESLINDIIQEVFLTLLKRPELIDNISNKKAWLLSCTKNKIIDHYRKHSPKLLQDDILFTLMGTNVPNILESYIENERLQETLDSLSPETKKLFILKYYYGFKYDEISELTGFPISTIKLRVFRAKKSLAERVRQYEGE